MNKSSTKETDLEKRLATACRGLVYVSETDSPVVPFLRMPSSKVGSTELSFDTFFNRLTTKKGWHTDAERKNAEGFARLKDLLESELNDIHVYKNGEIQLEITVAGRTKDGELAGVKMKAVET